MNFDFKKMENYHYFIIIGAGVAVLAALVAVLKGGKLKIPATLAVALSCLVVGFGAGVLALGKMGYKWTMEAEPTIPAGTQANVGDQGPMMAPKDPAIAPKGMGGGKGPNPKNQLVALVVKMNQLTEKPLSISLDAERKKKVAEQIKDLDTLETLTENDAKARIEALLELMKPDRPVMEAAGFNWPGSGGGGGGRGKDVPNPFKSERNEKAVKALQERVAAK